MKRTILTCLIATASITTSFSTLADDRSNDWKATANDAWIDGKVEATLLFNGQLNTFDINTDVNDGKVILTGKVGSEVDKRLATELAESIEGVDEVDNRLSVVTPQDYEGNWDTFTQDMKDAKIATVIKTRLLLESELSGTDINVDVSQGVVTLAGTVRNPSERDLAVAIAKNTADVSDVKSELSVDS
ncbi:BON domain-containing protein [Salinimonas iocasae]|uniref:BON domain-containing protein n=1 Tax=Salinimonas iocasae TaxID=2572577 RepID=A0A5B7YGX7_9ALTE|nr:BON domain-containing protein [Salinimonas iocasae]QCZ94887.1 BON domain-containing protein [Salinimonas iocasae]